MQEHDVSNIGTFIRAAEERLKTVDDMSCGDSFRLFHGRGKCFSGLEGLCVDIFFPVVLITAFDDYSEDFKSLLLGWVKAQLLPKGVSCVLYQYRQGSGVTNTVMLGEAPADFVAVRKRVQFTLSFAQQNVGFFLDIEPARCWLEQHASGKRVLNMFSYTCAFSVVASQAGAESVVNIDMSARSLSVGRENHRLNALPTENIKFLPHDIFKSWGKLKRLSPYDIVIIDPPSAQKGSFLEGKDYKRVWARMGALVAENGYVLTCLNAPNVSATEFKARACEALVAEGFCLDAVLPISADFCEHDIEMGLKMLVFKRVQIQ